MSVYLLEVHSYNSCPVSSPSCTWAKTNNTIHTRTEFTASSGFLQVLEINGNLQDMLQKEECLLVWSSHLLAETQAKTANTTNSTFMVKKWQSKNRAKNLSPVLRKNALISFPCLISASGTALHKLVFWNYSVRSGPYLDRNSNWPLIFWLFGMFRCCVQNDCRSKVIVGLDAGNLLELKNLPLTERGR